jgi:hypothetical protein
MRTLLSALLAAAIAVASCANQPEQPSTRPSPSVEAATPTEDVGAEIYAAVIRRLVTKDHTFGQGESPFKHVYVINGPIPDAGDPETVGDAFGPASEPFSSEVIAGIEEELKDRRWERCEAWRARDGRGQERRCDHLLRPPRAQ